MSKTDALKRAVAQVLENPPYEFTKEFRKWIVENWHVYEGFHALASQTAAGRDHYSAYTVREVLRWHTDLREVNTEFKISNNITPDMARMFNAIIGRLFFRLKRRKGELDAEEPI
jgi:hypothetical protein